MHTAFIIILTVCFIAIVSLVYLSVTRKDREKSVFFIVFTAALSLYVLGYLLEVMSPTLESAVTALKVQNTGIPLIAPFFLLFALSICRSKLLRGWMPFAFLCYGAVIFLIALSNDCHGLYYSSVAPVYDSWGNILLSLGRGPVYYLQQAVNNTAMLMSFGFLTGRFLSGTVRIRRQISPIIAGSFLSFVTYILYFADLFPNGVDPIPIATSIGAALTAASIYRYRLFDIEPIALGAAVDVMEDAMVVLDREWCYTFSNRAAHLFFPGLQNMKYGEPIFALPSWPKEFIWEGESLSLNYSREDAAGKLRHYRADAHIITGSGNIGIGWNIVVRDVTDASLRLEELSLYATTDPLTGIYNRRYFLEALERELEASQRHPADMALVMFDLDRFKALNDKYGHLAGDHVLRSVADTIKRQLRPYDILARYGGEEFVIFLRDMKEDSLEPFVQRLCDHIAATETEFSDQKLCVTASFGATNIRAGSSIEEIIAAADGAMYGAKKAGRNQVMIAGR